MGLELMTFIMEFGHFQFTTSVVIHELVNSSNAETVPHGIVNIRAV